MSEMKTFIKDLKEKDQVQSIFLVTEKNSGTDRNGKTFLSLTLSDASGHINGRMFERAAEAGQGFDVGDPVWIKGFVQLFQNRRQMILHEIRRATDGEFEMTDLVAELGGDPKKHLQELLEIVDSLDNSFARELLRRTLNDPEINALLLRAPAAKTIHHAYRGGLIEHIHSITKMMVWLSEHYPFLDKNLLVFGAIFHDLGKVFELGMDDGIQYTQSGRLIGHMVLACEIVDRIAGGIPDFPVDLRDVMKHIILSHHGKLEYGSPKLPMILEAVVVSMIDDLDSKVNTISRFLKSEVQSLPPNEKWSHYHAGFERYFFLDFFRKRVES